MKDGKVNSIKLTQRKIKQQTNIHGHETPEELLEKREIKIQTIDKEISKGIVDALKADPEECKKKISHIKSLQKTTNNEIEKIFKEFSKKAINELREKIKNKMNDELKEKIEEKWKECEKIRQTIMLTENDVNDLNKKKEERENSQKIINELAKRFKTIYENTIEIISLLENNSFSQEITKKLKGYDTYLKIYYSDKK